MKNGNWSKGHKGWMSTPNDQGKNPPVMVETPRNETQDGEKMASTNVDETYAVFSSVKFVPPIPALPSDTEPAKVIIVQGLPASGKSTWSKKVIDSYPAGTVARINNDDLSTVLFGTPWTTNIDNAPQLLRSLRLNSLKSLLSNKSIRIIIVDNTNLAGKTVSETFYLAKLAGADVQVEDRFLKVPVEECLRRNRERDNPVPDEVILRMHKQASRMKKWQDPEFPEIQRYPNDDETLEEVVIVDIDGTVAEMNSRSPYDWGRVHEDTPIHSTVRTVKDMIAARRKIIFISGRDGAAYEDSRKWLETHIGEGFELFMKEKGDNRPDVITKHEIFQKEIAGKYRVSHVLDDRNGVVDLWRRLGLPCWQVAEGDF